MKSVICTIHDAKVGAFTMPVYFRTEGAAHRSFEQAMKEDPNISKWPADYNLYILGTFDDDNAKFELLEVPRLMATGAEVNSTNVIQMKKENR